MNRTIASTQHRGRVAPAATEPPRPACTDEDPELFFPIGETGPALLQIEQAKTVCARCPLTERCLQEALESGQSDGVWGGLSAPERRSLKRRTTRGRAAKGVR